jgi:hypothetical protein
MDLIADIINPPDTDPQCLPVTAIRSYVGRVLLTSSVADPGSWAFLIPASGIRDMFFPVSESRIPDLGL